MTSLIHEARGRRTQPLGGSVRSNKGWRTKCTLGLRCTHVAGVTLKEEKLHHLNCCMATQQEGFDGEREGGGCSFPAPW